MSTPPSAGARVVCAKGSSSCLSAYSTVQILCLALDPAIDLHLQPYLDVMSTGGSRALTHDARRTRWYRTSWAKGIFHMQATSRIIISHASMHLAASHRTVRTSVQRLLC